MLELFRLIAMNCGQKLFNPLSCAARVQQMTSTCGRIANYASCVAREPLWHTITVRNQNTTQARYGTRPFDVLLSGDEQSGADEQANFVKAFLTQANRVAEASFHTCRYVSVVLQISYQIQLIVTLKY